MHLDLLLSSMQTMRRTGLIGSVIGSSVLFSADFFQLAVGLVP
jgi:hypothetical protein